ncbi:hypothetical protein [Streptomyces sp. NBC_01298]|uniref:hypothetical protein n=1 Tax=Streptomyces sp. NBC_01298 TaxID=2903817 RepID=UPI002E153BB7
MARLRPAVLSLVRREDRLLPALTGPGSRLIGLTTHTLDGRNGPPKIPMGRHE